MGCSGANSTKTTRTRLRVGLLLAENFTLSAFALFIDHLRLAADEGDLSRQLHIEWMIMATSLAPVRSSCGVMTSPTNGFLDPASLDYVVVVGGVLHGGPQIDAATARYLRRADQAGAALIGLCTGSFILCRLGLMVRRKSCVSWYHYQDFMDEFPGQDVVADRLFVDDGDRITCAGGAGVADLATHLIERHIGWSAAQKASQVLQFDRTRGGAEAQPHPLMSQKVGDPRVRRALLVMEQNLGAPLPIARIAEKLDLSLRQFERLFHATLGIGPACAYRRLRLQYAYWLVENTERTVTDIAYEAGFSDCAHFCRQFKQTYGASPTGQRIRGDARGYSGDRAGVRVFS